MPETVEKRNIPSLTLRALLAPDSVNLEARTVDVTWTTGAKVLRGYYDQFYEELSLDPKHVRLGRLNNGAPMLDAHNGYSLRGVIGVVVPGTAKLKGNSGTATVRFAKAEDDPNADQIFRKVVDGIIQNVSVGYNVYRYETVDEADKKIPTRRATDWEPFEISPVPMGADDGAGFRSSEGAPQHECEFVTRELAEMPEQNPTLADVAAQVRAAVVAEQERSQLIRTAVRGAIQRLDASGRVVRSGLTAADADAIETAAVNGNTAVDVVRADVLARLAAIDDATVTRSQHTAEITNDSRDKYARGAAAWLYTRTGVAPLIQEAQKQFPNHAAFRGIEFDAGEFRGMTLFDMARDSLELHGVRTRGMSKHDVVGLAFTRADGMNSTSDFPVLLENVMHKSMLGAYMTTPDTWSRWCGVKTVSDFRDHNYYRLGSFGTLDLLNEHGEFKNKSIPDGERVKLNVGTRGNIIAITRQAIINDDLGAINETAMGYGRSSKLTIEVAAYLLLQSNAGLGPIMADGQAFFHANRKNVGTGAALSVDSIDADRVIMGLQRDPSGNELLDMRPNILLTPLQLGGAARVINRNEYDPSVSNKFQVANKVRGLFGDVIDTGRLTDATRRYMFADPAMFPAFVVTFLEGQSEPFMETKQGWRMDGVEWKLRLDFGVKEFDPRAAITNAGA